jgi:hypothetical protein
MTLASLLLALAASNATPSWIVRTQTNLIGQPEAVAELAESADAPGRYLKFSCSVMSGPILEIGLGARSFESFSNFSAAEAARADKIAITMRQQAGAPLQIVGEPVPDQVTSRAFVVGGVEATTAARYVAGAESLNITAESASAEFAVSGASGAIGEVLTACPFK